MSSSKCWRANQIQSFSNAESNCHWLKIEQQKPLTSWTTRQHERQHERPHGSLYKASTQSLASCTLPNGDRQSVCMYNVYVYCIHVFKYACTMQVHMYVCSWTFIERIYRTIKSALHCTTTTLKNALSKWIIGLKVLTNIEKVCIRGYAHTARRYDQQRFHRAGFDWVLQRWNHVR